MPRRVAQAEPARVFETVATADGAQLVLRRRPAAGAPIVFLPGLAANADLWDLPTVAGRDFEYRSLATLMHEAGHDIWLVNFRGHGGPEMLSTPPAGQADWSVDHFILYDLPAVLEHVQRSSGRRPFVVGASMGAMVLAGYLQGAVLVESPSAMIRADPLLAQRRNAAIGGAIFVEFPAALRWPRSLFDEYGNVRWQELARDWWRTDGDANYPFELLARSAWLETLIVDAGRVPLEWMRPSERSDSLFERFSPATAARLRAMKTSLTQAGLDLLGRITGHSQHRAEVILEGRARAIDHMKAGVLRQMGKSVRARAFVSDLGSPAHAYSEHYALLTAPLLVIAGGRDRIANAAVTREAFFERVCAVDKEFRLFEEFAHGEFEAAPRACERVYPGIADWIRNRNALADAAD